jgi:uncharacterized protein
MKTISNHESSRPWHKEFYVWMMLFFPMLAVVGCIITIILAIKSNDGLVVDDYYKKGLEINRTLERDKKALDYQLNADINLNQEFGEVAMVLTAVPDFEFPENLSVSFLNATRLGFDQEVNMILTGDNIYRGNVSALVSGKWYVHIQRDNWRLIKTINVN